MALSVTTNIASINAQRNLAGSTEKLNKSLERLSTGLRINRAGDDAAGLAISEGLRSQIRGLNQAVRNANDGLSMISTAESAINTYTNIVQRIRELAIQSANDTNSPANRAALNQEVQEQLKELERIASTIDFNGTKLLDGSFTTKQLQVGARAHQTIEISMGNLLPKEIGQVTKEVGNAVSLGGALADGDITLNGVSIAGYASDGVSFHDDTFSAIAIANAINDSTASHNVTASVGAAVYETGQAVAGGSITVASEQLHINGIDIFDGDITISANDADGALVDAINAKRNQTGVLASMNGNNLVLTAEDGRNIRVTTTGSIGDELGFNASDGAADVEQGGTITLNSPDDIILGEANSGAAKAGFSAQTYTKDPNLALNMISITTVEGANLAIEQVDNALEQINAVRGSLGAFINRLENTINNLQAVSENLQASDSRIRDADFASETAELTKNQILQQAGISILSQANTTTQAALQLLQG